MNILALDLATKTGWACRDNGQIRAGTWTLATPKQLKGRDECAPDLRLLWLRSRLTTLCNEFHPMVLAYENVQFVQSRAQGFLWAGLRAMVWLVAHEQGIRTIGCPVKTLKKFATGNGNADKDEMAAALYTQPDMVNMPPNLRTLDDNGVDAVHLLFWAESQSLTNPKNSTP